MENELKYKNEGYPQTLVFFKGESEKVVCVIDVPDDMTTQELTDIIRVQKEFGRTRWEYR